MWLSKIFCGLFVIAGICSGVAAMGHENSIRGKLSEAQKAIIPIAAFTANGDSKSLATALEEGLDKGLSINGIKEILVQMYAYAGFPRSLTGLNTFMNVLDARKKRGIQDTPGAEPETLPPNTDRMALGTRIQTGLVGRPVAGPLFEFSPAIDAFLKEHLFCDIFSRGVLTNQERELATVAALAALPAETQLASPLNVCLNVGLTEPQLREYVAVLAEKVGAPQSETASRVLDKALRQRKKQ